MSINLRKGSLSKVVKLASRRVTHVRTCDHLNDVIINYDKHTDPSGAQLTTAPNITRNIHNKNNIGETMPILLAIILIAFLFTAGPLIAIWAINVLFPVALIPITFKTWFAAFCLVAIFGGSASASKK